MKIQFLFLFAVIFVFIVMGEAQPVEDKDYLTVDEFLRIKRLSPFLKPECKKGKKKDIRGRCRTIVI